MSVTLGARRRTVCALVAMLALAAGLARADDCSRVVAVGDLHGGVDSLVTMLGTLNLVGEDGAWVADDTCLVVVGDLVDRGDRSREVLDLLMRLQAGAPERVHVTLGNHEVMNLVGDLRYVTPGDFAAYADDETKKQRQRGYDAFLETRAARQLGGRGERKEAFDRAFPPGWFAHRAAFSPDGRYGAWLLSRPVLLELGGTLFVHGGIEPPDAAVGVEALDREIVSEIREYLALREQLVEAGWLSPLAPFGEAFGIVERRLAQSGGDASAGASDGDREAAERFLELRQARFVQSDGPLWTRKLAREDEAAYGEAVQSMLRDLGVERIVVGHTTQEDHRIKARFEGHVFLIDTGAGPAYGSHPSALVIEDGTVRAVYPDEVVVLESGAVAAGSVP